MLSTGPLKMCAIAPVTRQARFICLRCRGIRGRIRRLTHFCSCARFGVLLAVAVANLTVRSACVFEVLGTLTVRVERKSLNNEAVTL
jgi:hypothetical protein